MAFGWKRKRGGEESSLEDEPLVVAGAGDDERQPDLLESFSADADGVLTVGKSDYAVNLFWQTVSSHDKAASEARKMATQEGVNADFFCHPFKTSQQVGLGLKESSHKAGMPVLAAHLMTSLGGDKWIGLFKVGQIWYLVAVRDENILATTDRVYMDADEARERFNELYTASDWNQIFCPGDLGIPDSVTSELEEILIGRPTARLRPVDNKSLIIRSVAGLGALGLLLFAFMKLQPILFPPEEFDFASLTRPAREQVQQQTQQQQPPVPPAPWTSSPSASSFIVSCVEKVSKTSLYYPGWDLESIECRDNTLVRRLKRTTGTVNWIEPYVVERLGEADAIIRVAGRDAATISTPIGNKNRLPDALSTEQISEVVPWLFSHLDETGHVLQTGKVDLTEEEHVYFAASSYSFKTRHNPREFLPLLSRVSAITVDSIVYDMRAKTWDIKGTIYEKRIRPLIPVEE